MYPKNVDRMASLPLDRNQNAVQLVPAVIPLKTTYSTANNTAVNITLQSNTSFVEVHAITSPIVMRWRTSSGDTAVSLGTDGYHELIGAGVTRMYQVPNASITIVSFLEQAANSVLSVIEK